MKTSRELIHRVSNKLSNLPKSSVAVFGNLADAEDREEDTVVLYTLRQNYGGDARRPVKPFVRKGGYLRKLHKTPRRVCQRPIWMQGILGCFFQTRSP